MKQTTSKFELARFGKNKLPWHNPESGRPADMTACLIVVNGAIPPEVFVYFAEPDLFIAGTEQSHGFCRFDDVQAWIGKHELPLPTFPLRPLKPIEEKSDVCAPADV